MNTSEIPPAEHLHAVIATVTKPDKTVTKQIVNNFIIPLVLVIVYLLTVSYYCNKPTTEDDSPAIVDVINLQQCSVSLISVCLYSVCIFLTST